MDESVIRLRASELEDSGDVGVNPTANGTMGEVIAARFNRRDLLRGTMAVTAISATLGHRALAADQQPARQVQTSSFDFKEIEAGVDGTHHVAEGYDAQILLRWGDPVLPGAPAFDPKAQTARGAGPPVRLQHRFRGLHPHRRVERPRPARREPRVHQRGADVPRRRQPGRQGGGLRQDDARARRHRDDGAWRLRGGDPPRERGAWRVVADSRYARRITAETPMEITGPAAGHERMRTSADGAGRTARGTVNNCAGGVTPWGTWLTCEENFNGYFWGKLPEGHAETVNYKRYAHRHAGLRLGQVPRPLRPRKGAERGQPLRLGGGDRPLRPDLRAPQAHGARPHQARGRGRHRRSRRALRDLSRRRRALRLRLQVRHLRPGRPAEPGRQSRAAGRGHPVRRQVRRGRHGRLAADGAGPGPAHPGQRLRDPGGRR